MANDLVFASETDWFAVDADDHVAFFSTGFGPIPKQIAWKYARASALRDSIAALPASSTISSQMISSGMPRFVDLAVRGVFTFIWDDYDGPYVPVVRPDKPVLLSALPFDLATRLAAIRFTNLHFLGTSQITRAFVANDLVLTADAAQQ